MQDKHLCSLEQPRPMSDEPKHTDDPTPGEQPQAEDEPKDASGEPGAGGRDEATPETGSDSPPTDDEQPKEDADSPQDESADASGDESEDSPEDERETSDEGEDAPEPDEDETKDIETPPASDESEAPGDGAAAAAGGEPAEGDEEPDEAPEEEAPKAPPQYDGLDSGLAWFGAEPFVPPLPTGYVAREIEGEAAAPMGRAALAERKLSVRERLEARRAETDATKKWYQKVPIPVWLCMPATIFIIVWVLVVAKPWAQIPGPREAMDETLLTAAALDDDKVSEALIALGVGSMTPIDAFQPLGGGVLRMDKTRRAATLTFEVPEGKQLAEMACEVAIAEWHPGSEYAVSLSLDPNRMVELLGNQYPKQLRGGQEAQRVDFYASFWPQGRQVMRVRSETALKLKHWYRLRMVVDRNLTTCTINGKQIGEAAASGGTAVRAATLKVENARILVRNLVVEPAAAGGEE